MLVDELGLDVWDCLMLMLMLSLQRGEEMGSWRKDWWMSV